MTINTGISSALLQPKTFHVMSYLLGGRSLQTLAQRAVLIGNKSPAGPAAVATVVPITDPGEVDGLFGIGSPLALMARKAFEQAARSGAGPALYAVPLAETTTARVHTITVTGPATADGDVVIRIAGRKMVIGVASGSSATTIALAISNAIAALKQSLPITASPAVGVVTCTCTVKGTFGNDIVYEVISYPAGTTVVAAQTVAGAGALDIQTALDAILGLEFDGIAIQTHAAGDITEISAQIAATWTAAEKKPRWFFVGEPGSVGTATPLASSANHEGVVIVSCEQSPSLPCEIATAAMVCALSKSRPNANYNNATLAIYPPPDAYAYTSTEIETLLTAGVTPLAPIVNAGKTVDGVVRVARMVTTRTTLSSQPSTILLDLGISRSAWYMAKQYDIAYAARFGSDNNPDGVVLDADTIQQIRDMVLALQYAAQDLKILTNVDANKALLQVEADPSVIGRVNVDDALTVVPPLHQVAFVHRVSTFLGA